MQHLWRRLGAGTLPARFAQLGRWWNGADEIDLVGLWRGRVTLVGECKWTAAAVDEGVLAALQQKAQKLPLGERPLWVLAARFGFTPALRRRAARGDLLLLTPADLFEQGKAPRTTLGSFHERYHPKLRGAGGIRYPASGKHGYPSQDGGVGGAAGATSREVALVRSRLSNQDISEFPKPSNGEPLHALHGHDGIGCRSGQAPCARALDIERVVVAASGSRMRRIRRRLVRQ